MGKVDRDLDDLRIEDAFFTSLINTIPPSYYFDEETKQAFTKNELGSPKKGKKKKQLKASKIMHLKLDPSKQKTITQLQKELAEESLKEKSSSDAKIAYGAASDNVRQNFQKKIKQLRGKRKASTNEDRQNKKARRLLEKQKKKKKKNKLNEPKPTEAKPVAKKAGDGSPKKRKFNEDGGMLFSKFEFSEYEQPKKKSDGKDYAALLKKAQKEKETQKALRATDPEKARTVNEKKAWQKALKLAEGSKIKDDPELLKKALRKKEERKAQSKKKWTQRVDTIEEKMKRRQQKRKANITAKKQEKVKKKIKRAIKKGRFIPE